MFSIFSKKRPPVSKSGLARRTQFATPCMRRKKEERRR